MTERRLNQTPNPERTDAEKAVTEGRQSPNWEKYKDLKKKLSWEEQKELDKGFPYREGFPHTPRAYNGGLYELISYTGERFTAKVDYSTQYRAEGLNWEGEFGELIPNEYCMVAWKEYDPKQNDKRQDSSK